MADNNSRCSCPYNRAGDNPLCLEHAADGELARQHELDRQEYNCAVANGLIIKARAIDRVMKARERRFT
jgi:hypothetical protein